MSKQVNHHVDMSNHHQMTMIAAMATVAPNHNEIDMSALQA